MSAMRRDAARRGWITRRQRAAAQLATAQALYRKVVGSIPVVGGAYLGKKMLKPYKGRSFRGTGKKTTVKKQLKDIRTTIRSNTGYLTHKKRTPHALSCNPNEMNMTTISPLTTSELEDCLTAVPYFSGGVLGNINLTDDAFQRKVLFKSVSASLTLRNNRITPCEVRVYVFKIKTDTGNSPTTLFQTGLADQMDAAQTKHPMLYPSDVEQVKALWTQVKCHKKILNSGQEMVVSHTEKDIGYDTSLSDTHPQTYQKGHKSFVFVVRMEGRPAHKIDVPTDIGSCPSRLTMLMDVVKKIEYDSGSNGTKRIITVNNSATLTEGDAVVAQVTRRLQNSSSAEGY